MRHSPKHCLLLMFFIGITRSIYSQDRAVDELERSLGARGMAFLVKTEEKPYVQVQIHRDTDQAIRSLALLSHETRHSVARLIIREPSNDARTLRSILSFHSLISLDVCENGWASSLAGVIPQLPHLTELWLEGAGVDGDGLRSIAQAQKLEVLMIGRNRFSAPDLECLSKLSELRQLSVSGSSIETKHLGFLQELQNLRSLQLIDTAVGDDIVPIVAKCKKVKILALVGTKVTQRGAETLSELLPSAIISYGRDE